MRSSNIPNDKVLRAASKKLKDAKPSSGFTPETAEEWNKAQVALVEIGYSMFRDMGAPHEKAQALAQGIYGGQNGRVLLDAALNGHRHAK